MAFTIEENKDLTSYTTFGIPVKARWFAEYSNQRELERILRSEQYKIGPVLHIGGGSNLLFAEDYDGLVMHSAIKGITIYRKNEDDVYLIAGAGEVWDDVVSRAIAEGLGGLENLAGIPGEAGASAVQNIGAYGVEAADYLFSVECFDLQTRQTVRFSNEECRFGYRDSMFKHGGRGRYIVLRVSYKLTPCTIARHLEYGPLKDLAVKLGHAPTIAEVREEVIKIRNSKLPDPKVIGSAGSFFKNPFVSRYMFNEELLSRNPDIPSYDVNEHLVKVPAAWLIDKCGLKGMKKGGAEVWPSQPLVIANTDGATAEDVVGLMHEIMSTVHEKFGITLHPEVNIIDSKIEVTILGTGTSKGVPEAGCSCRVCRSTDPHDKRQRTSALVKTQGLNILIDVSPDFRQQAIIHNITDIDAALITHEHYDHVGGIDDLRPYNGDKNIGLYMRRDVSDALHKRIDYCFREHPYPGVPVFDVHIIGNEPFSVDGVKVTPINVMHGSLPIVGFRIGDFAYITDAKTIDEDEREKLHGLKVLIVNALRERDHFAHFNVKEALELIEDVKPEQAYLTHMCHHYGLHKDADAKLPENVHTAYDGMKLVIKKGNNIPLDLMEQF